MENILFQNASLLRAALGELSYATLISMPRSLAGHDIDAADYASDVTGSQSKRDLIQAENLWSLWQVLGLKRKAILFEHNFHVARYQSELPNPSWPNVKSTAEFLGNKLGSRYRSIGWTAYRHQAYYMKNEALSDNPDSIDLELNLLSGDTYLIDTRGYFAESKAWSMQASPEKFRLSRQFDFLFYTREAGPATPYFK